MKRPSRRSCVGSQPRAAHARGFTLIEVLVALAVIAVALAALVKAAGTFTSDTGYLRDKTLAQWVALNKAAEYQTGLTKATTSSGTEKMGGHEWYWDAATEPTDDSYVLRLRIAVRAQRDARSPTATVVTFLPSPKASQ